MRLAIGGDQIVGVLGVHARDALAQTGVVELVERAIGGDEQRLLVLVTADHQRDVGGLGGARGIERVVRNVGADHRAEAAAAVTRRLRRRGGVRRQQLVGGHRAQRVELRCLDAELGEQERRQLGRVLARLDA